MKLFVASSILVAGCWSGPSASPPPAHPAPVAEPAHLRRPLLAEFGTFEDTGFHATRDVPLVAGTGFGWRLHLPCTHDVTFREELRLPAPGDWGPNPDIAISDDGRVATVHDQAECSSEGWIEKTWTVSANDPPGTWTLRVFVEGFVPQTFSASFATPTP